MEKLFDDIHAYMKYLTSERKIDVCFCSMRFLPPEALQKLAVYYGHFSPRCTKIKDGGNQRKCWKMQALVRRKCKLGEPFFGCCYAGVEEYIFPVNEDGKTLGFISVGAANHSMDKLQPIIAPLVNTFRLLYRYVKETPHKSPQKGTYYSALRFIADNYTRKLSLETIAAELNYSPSYLAHVFNAQNGTPIMTYVRALKTEKARQLLLSTNRSIVEISQTVGFDTPNYFTTVFKKVYGVSPREYRAVRMEK